MRVDALHGVRPYDTHAGADERGSVVQLRRPVGWQAERICTVHNALVGTLRGLHFQEPGAYKIVACTAGEVFDVLVDLRSEQRYWASFNLKPGGALLVPPGFAHGYITLQPNTSMVYLLEGVKNDDLGIRWDDPKIGTSIIGFRPSTS